MKRVMVLAFALLFLPALACALDLSTLEPQADGKVYPGYAISDGRLTLSGTTEYPIVLSLGSDMTQLDLWLDNVSVSGGHDTALAIACAPEGCELTVYLEGENTLSGALAYDSPVGDTGASMRLLSRDGAQLTVGGISVENDLTIDAGMIISTDAISAGDLTITGCEIDAQGVGGAIKAVSGSVTVQNAVLRAQSDGEAAISAYGRIDIAAGSDVTVISSGLCPVGITTSGLMTIIDSTVSADVSGQYAVGINVSGNTLISGESRVQIEVRGDDAFGFATRNSLAFRGGTLTAALWGARACGLELLDGHVNVRDASRLSCSVNGEDTTGVRILTQDLQIEGGEVYVKAQGQAVDGVITCSEKMIAQHRDRETDPWVTFAENTTQSRCFRSLESIPFTYTIADGGVTITGYTGEETDIVIPQKIEHLPVTEIGSGAFMQNYDITSVTLPDGIRTIGSNAFQACSALESINLPEGLTQIRTQALYNCDKLQRIVLPESLQTIGNQAFGHCDMLTDVTIPAQVSAIGGQAFAECPAMTEIGVDPGNARFVSVDGVLYTRSMDAVLCYPAGKAGTEYVLPDTVVTIGEGAFARNRQLTRITLPSGVTTIGKNAFSSAALREIALPSGVTTIGSSAFSGSKIQQIVLPDSVTEIGSQAFNSCYSLERAVLPKGLAVIEGYMFSLCRSLTDVVIPQGVQQINQMAFYGTGLTDVVLPEGVETIEYQSFANCDALERIVIPMSVASIHDAAFSGSENVVAHVYPGSAAHDWCEEKAVSYELLFTPAENFTYEINNGEVEITGYTGKASVVMIPAQIEGCPVTTIGNRAFLDCTFLTDVQIPQSVTSIQTYAFDGCTGLETLVLPDDIPSFSKRPFDGGILLYCRRGSVTAGALEEYGRFHLYLDSDPENPLTIVDGVVIDCDPAAVNVVVPQGVTAIGDKAFLLCGWLENITLPQGIVSIGNSAFDSCFSMKNIILPDGIETIGDMAFAGCEAIESIELPAGVKSIGESAFDSCIALRKLVIPEGVESIGDDALHSCISLEEIVLPDTITQLGSGVFYENGIRSVKLPAGLEEIGVRMFMFCENLESIEIPQGVTNIGDSAFYGCRAMMEIELPDSVVSIGNDAFSECSSLYLIRIPDSVVIFGEDVFGGCADELTAMVDYDSAAYHWCIETGVSYELAPRSDGRFGSSREEILERIGHASGASYAQGDRAKAVQFIQTVLEQQAYYFGDITGSFGVITKRAAEAFQADYGLAQTGGIDESQLLLLIDVYLGVYNEGVRMVYEETFYNPDWNEAKAQLKEIGVTSGAVLYLTDLLTDITFRISVQSLSGHIDAEPLTAADTAALCRAYGVSSAEELENRYERRPMLLTIAYNGMNVQIVSSLYGVPHGADTIADNGYDGQFCLYLSGSLAHGTQVVNPDHEAAIAQAAAIMTEKTTVTWAQIHEGVEADGAFAKCRTSAVLSEGSLIVSGGTVHTAEIVSLPAGAQEIVFDNVRFAGDGFNVAAAQGTAMRVVLLSGVTDATRDGARIVSRGGIIDFESDASLQELHISVYDGGEITAVNRGAVDELINVYSAGRLSFENHGQTPRGISAGASNGDITVINTADTRTVQCYVEGESTACVQNGGNLSGLLGVGTEQGAVLTAVNTGVVAGMSVEAGAGGSTTMTNDGTVTNERGLDGKNVYIYVDYMSSVTLNGSGTIAPGYMSFDYVTLEGFEEAPAESIQVHLGLNAFGSVSAVRYGAVRTYRRNVSIDLSGVQAHEGKDQVIVIARYSLNNEPDACLIRQKELY